MPEKPFSREEKNHNPSSPPLTLRGGTFPFGVTPQPSAPPLKIRGGRGSYDPKGQGPTVGEPKAPTVGFKQEVMFLAPLKGYT